MAEPATVTVVVPTCGRPETLGATLDSLVAAETPPGGAAIVVVDDRGGDPATADVVAARQGRGIAIDLVLEHGAGAGGARNSGARRARGDLLLFCDDDVAVERDHLRLHLDAHARHRRALVSGVTQFSPAVRSALEHTPFGRYRIELEERYESEADAHWIERHLATTPLVSARNLSIERAVFEELGGFDASFPHAGAEDQDLSLRAAAAGCVLLRDHRIRALNNEPIVTFEQFCLREERSAGTLVILVSRFPQEAERPLYAENRPARRGDSPRTVARKAAKRLLSGRLALAALHSVAGWLERAGAADALIRPVYRTLLGLHAFRGVRAAVQRAEPPVQREP